MRIGLYLVLLLGLAGAVGCHDSKPQPAVSVAETQTPLRDYTSTGESTPQSIYHADTFFYQDASGSMVARWVDSVYLPNEKYAVAEVKQLATYHGDEVNSDLVHSHWYGLFVSNDGKQYLKSTSISINRAKDVVLDEGKEMTGKEITTDIDDSCIALIGGLKTLREGPVEPIVIGQKDSSGVVDLETDFSFQLKGISYRLQISKERVQLSPTNSVDLNYKVYLVGEKDGREVKQLIIAKPYPDFFSQLKWVGDLDADGLPDLIIDTSCQDNAECITIYLSSFAKDDELVKMIGFDSMVGC